MADRCITRSRGLIAFKVCPSADEKTFDVTAEDARAGTIARAQFEAFELRGKRMLKVASINTEAGVRRAGVGTAIYELALDQACERDMQLVSDAHRSEWAEAFWREQRAKGRAVCLNGNGKGKYGPNYYAGPRASTLRDIEERCTKKFSNTRKVKTCIRKETRAVLKSLPKPRTADGKQYWPCQRYGIKRSLCKADASRKLDGVAPQKKPRNKKKGPP